MRGERRGKGIMGYRKKGWAGLCLHFFCRAMSLCLAQITIKRGKNVLTVGKCWLPECSWGCNDVRTFLQAYQFSCHKWHWHTQMSDDIVSMQQAQNPSNNFKCWKLIENDSFHIRLFCWQRGKQILPFAKAQENSCIIFFWSALAVLIELLADADIFVQRE